LTELGGDAEMIETIVAPVEPVIVPAEPAVE